MSGNVRCTDESRIGYAHDSANDIELYSNPVALAAVWIKHHKRRKYKRHLTEERGMFDAGRPCPVQIRLGINDALQHHRWRQRPRFHLIYCHLRLLLQVVSGVQPARLRALHLSIVPV